MSTEDSIATQGRGKQEKGKKKKKKREAPTLPDPYAFSKKWQHGLARLHLKSMIDSYTIFVIPMSMRCLNLRSTI